MSKGLRRFHRHNNLVCADHSFINPSLQPLICNASIPKVTAAVARGHVDDSGVGGVAAAPRDGARRKYGITVWFSGYFAAAAGPQLRSVERRVEQEGRWKMSRKRSGNHWHLLFCAADDCGARIA